MVMIMLISLFEKWWLSGNYRRFKREFTGTKWRSTWRIIMISRIHMVITNESFHRENHGVFRHEWWLTIPRCSTYGIFPYIWVIFGVTVGKYSTHGSYGIFPSGMILQWASTAILIPHATWGPCNSEMSEIKTLVSEKKMNFGCKGF